MRLRYTRRAASQLDAALAFVQARSPQGADGIQGRLLAIMALIRLQPYAGHPTTRPGVFRIAIVPYLYVVDYRVTGDEIIVQRFRHAARRPVA